MTFCTNKTVVILDPSQIGDPIYLLRPVDKSSTEYLELTESIKSRGVLNAILVRPTSDTGDSHQLIDGFWRLSVCRDLKMPVPCVVQEATDDELMSLQVVANSHRVETQPAHYARHLLRIQARTNATIDDLAILLNRSPVWVRNQLSLTKLVPAAQAAVDDGRLPLLSAYALAQVPESLQYESFDKALELSSADFRRWLAVEKQNVVAGEGLRGFEPKPYLRSAREIQKLLADPAQIHGLAVESTTSAEAFAAALKWVMHLDEPSIQAAQSKWLLRQNTELKRTRNQENQEKHHVKRTRRK